MRLVAALFKPDCLAPKMNPGLIFASAAFR